MYFVHSLPLSFSLSLSKYKVFFYFNNPNNKNNENILNYILNENFMHLFSIWNILD